MKLALESVSFGQVLFALAVGWIVVLLPVLMFSSGWRLLAFGAVTAVFVLVVSILVRKKMTALGSSEPALFHILGWPVWGIVAWNPNEGVLFLKEKKIGPVDSNPNDGGGVMMIVPLLGEELAFRAPLEPQTTRFEDHNVLTREYVPLKIRGAIYWRLVDLERFYLNVSRFVHAVDDRDQVKTIRRDSEQPKDEATKHSGTMAQLAAGVEWLRLIAEEQTRAVVSQARTGLLIANKIVEGLPTEMQALIADDSYSSAADGLAESIRAGIDAIAPECGLRVERVSLQEVEIPPEIRQQAIEACKSAYRPLVAQRDAAATKMAGEAAAYGRRKMLEGEAEVIGADSVGKREVVGSVQPFALGGRSIVDVLGPFFESLDTTRNIGGGSAKAALSSAKTGMTKDPTK